jgi:dextranase
MEQYKNAICSAGFDGIHMDTYGFPKTAVSKLNGIDSIESLRDHFAVLINNTRKALEKVRKDICLIFNNVGNWPVDATAKADQDAVYIEVWKPYERYHHIQQIIHQAKYMGGGKPVILAAYLKPFYDKADDTRGNAEAAALILTAVIASNGGYHLLLGEKEGILTQGYYVEYARYKGDFIRTIRNYYDFIVRYSNIFFDNGLEDVSMTHADADNREYVFQNFQYSTYGEPGKVWVVIREKPERKTISFINLSGNGDDFWNKGKNWPDKISNLCVEIQVERDIKSLFLATPDSEMGRAQEPEYCVIEGERGKTLVVNIKELSIWSILVVEFDANEEGVNGIEGFKE